MNIALELDHELGFGEDFFVYLVLGRLGEVELRVGLCQGMNVVHKPIGILDLEFLVHHHAQDVGLIQAAFLVQNHIAGRGREGFALESALDEDHHVRQPAVFADQVVPRGHGSGVKFAAVGVGR